MARIGRKPAVAPPGYMTIAEVAKKLGLSYSGVYANLHFAPGSMRDESGVIYVPADELEHIKAAATRKPAEGDRAVTIRPTSTELARWEAYLQEITPENEKPMTVSAWLRRIANAWAGVK